MAVGLPTLALGAGLFIWGVVKRPSKVPATRLPQPQPVMPDPFVPPLGRP